jgi:hypothetical protein
MTVPDREQDARTNASHRPTFTLLTREVQKPPMEVKPAPGREDDHPPDEPGYGHGV